MDKIIEVIHSSEKFTPAYGVKVLDHVINKRVNDSIAKLETATRTALALEAVVAERKNRNAVLLDNVSKAKYRLSLQPQVEAYMLMLQHRVHQRSVGLYEQLLTALVQDVLPENKHPISLELNTEKGLPSLSIQLGKGESAQDIFEDTGGSLTNIVSSGLRFVALARSGLRKFLVLDEPDCWIEPYRIPRFADILAELSLKAGIQAILISHHDASAFVNLQDRIRLDKDIAGVIRAKHSRSISWLDGQPGIRWIRLERFMSHFDTKIELGPGINLLGGPNHVGKSAVAQALRVFCYHQGADRQIMHGMSDFIISVGLENGVVISCKRNRKGGRKTVYSLDVPGQAIRSEPAEKTQVPDFVSQYMRIERLNGLDIQLSHQKMPVFLLNEPGTKQASLLSAGLESDHVRTMLREYKTWQDVDRAIVRNDEKELGTLKTFLDEWDCSSTDFNLNEQSVTLEKRGAQLLNSLTLERTLMSLLRTLYNSERINSLVSDLNTPDLIVCTPSAPMKTLAQNWALAMVRTQICSSLNVSPTEPSTEYILSMAECLRKARGAEKRLLALSSLLDAPAEPGIENNSLMTIYNAWMAKKDSYDKTLLLHSKAQAYNEQSSAEYAEILQACGGVCPLCEQHIQETNI